MTEAKKLGAVGSAEEKPTAGGVAEGPDAGKTDESPTAVSNAEGLEAGEPCAPEKPAEKTTDESPTADCVAEGLDAGEPCAPEKPAGKTTDESPTAGSVAKGPDAGKTDESPTAVSNAERLTAGKPCAPERLAERTTDDTFLARLNVIALAYMGDAVYEAYVRKHVIDSGLARADRLHAAAVKFVRASGQAKALSAMQAEGFLGEEEAALVRRARNHKVSTKPKNADVVEYKKATAFEALVGFLYLSGNALRLEEIMARAVEIIEGK